MRNVEDGIVVVVVEDTQTTKVMRTAIKIEEYEKQMVLKATKGEGI